MSSARKPDPHKEIWDEAWKINYGSGGPRNPADTARELEALTERVRPEGRWNVDRATASMLLSSVAIDYMSLGRWHDALDRWNQIEEPGPDSRYRSACLWMLGHFEEAESGFKAALESSWRRSTLWTLFNLWAEPAALERDRLSELIRNGLPPSLAKRAKGATIPEIKNLLRTARKRVQ